MSFNRWKLQQNEEIINDEVKLSFKFRFDVDKLWESISYKPTSIMFNQEVSEIPSIFWFHFIDKSLEIDRDSIIGVQW